MSDFEIPKSRVRRGETTAFCFLIFGAQGIILGHFGALRAPPRRSNRSKVSGTPLGPPPGSRWPPRKRTLGSLLGGGSEEPQLQCVSQDPSISRGNMCVFHRGSGHVCFAPPEERPLSGGVPFLSRKPGVQKNRRNCELFPGISNPTYRFSL